MAEDVVPYPLEWEADVVLRDGGVAHLRPIQPEDAEAIVRFHERQSDESIYLRFFAPIRQLSERDLRRFTNVDHDDRVALVVTHRGEIIGVGRYDKITPTDAEVAFNVSDRHQGKGIGSVLLEHLAAIGREEGLTSFSAEVLPQNGKMLKVFADAGYSVSRRIEDGVVQVHFDIEPTEKSEEVRLAREHRAESLSIARLLAPRTIAVVGASREEGRVGHVLLRHLRDGGFTGDLYAVNPHADDILGVPTVDRLGAIEGPVDLVVIAVPAEKVLDVVDECAAADVHALVIVSAGFAESREKAGLKLERQVLRRARDSGMRIVGPTSFGLVNTSPEVSMNASFAPSMPGRGHFGLFSQSGPLGIAVLESAHRRGLGLSSFASVGNRLDVSGNDLMQFWMDDPATHAVGLYLESMGNPRKFSRIARRLALAKPVVVIKPGISRYGAPPGHRVRDTEVAPEAFAAMLGQAGAIHVENIHQMFDVAQVLIHQPESSGSRVAVVANSAQLAQLAAETSVSWGLDIVGNPTSVPPDSELDDFLRAVGEATHRPDVDAVFLCFAPPVEPVTEETLDALRSAVAGSDKTCVATVIGSYGVSGGLAHRAPTGGGAGETVDPARELPFYTTPEDAARALAAATRYAAWRRRDKGTLLPRQGVDRAAADALIEPILAQCPEGRDLTEDEVWRLLAAYGIDLWSRLPALTEDEAVDAARTLGYPVVLKSTSPLVRAQSVLTGVRIDLQDDAAVRAAFRSLSQALAPFDADHFVVQRMALQGVSTVVACSEDRLFGPVVRFSLAGISTDVLGDIGYRIPPLTDVDVTDLIGSIKGARLLDGYRGAPAVNRRALADIIGRVSMLGDDFSEIASIELNPVVVHPGGVQVLGATATIAKRAKRKDAGRRTLT